MEQKFTILEKIQGFLTEIYNSKEKAFLRIKQISITINNSERLKPQNGCWYKKCFLLSVKFEKKEKFWVLFPFTLQGW